MPKIRKKRPCCICRRWFLPNTKVKKRQVTCGEKACQRQWHKKQCAKWNKKNAAYFRSNYLQKKLEKTKEEKPIVKSGESPGFNKGRSPPTSCINLPIQSIHKVIETELLVVIDYVIKIQIYQFQKRMIKKAVVNKGSPFF